MNGALPPRDLCHRDGIAALPGIALGGGDFQAHLLAHSPRQEAANGMRLPARGLPEFCGRGAPGRFNRSRILATLLPSWATAAFLRPLGAFFAELDFLADLPVAGATCARRAPTRAFLVAFGGPPAAEAWAVPVSSGIVEVMCSPCAAFTAVTRWITLVRLKRKSNLAPQRKRRWNGDGAAR